jgi:hypothetical protein
MAVVVIACHISVVAVSDVSGGVGKTIPDGFSLAVLVPCAFDLI